jgi:hypothetical protein
MIELTETDAAILAYVADANGRPAWYKKVEMDSFIAKLSRPGRDIANVILHGAAMVSQKPKPYRDDVIATANEYRRWMKHEEAFARYASE